MKLNREELKAACYEVATNTMWEQRPVDVASIEAVATQFFDIAEDHEEFIVEQGRDPNLIIRAVRYLNHVHAMPPMGDDTRWFYNTLQVLIELACPNTGASRELETFIKTLKKALPCPVLIMKMNRSYAASCKGAAQHNNSFNRSAG